MEIETTEQLAAYSSVQKWLKNVHHQSPASTTTDEARLNALLKFCHLTQKDPDVIIVDCFREQKEGEIWRHIKFKTRRKYSNLIDQAQDEIFGGGTAGRQQGSIIRSFFIHNGVFMQATPLR